MTGLGCCRKSHENVDTMITFFYFLSYRKDAKVNYIFLFCATCKYDNLVGR